MQAEDFRRVRERDLARLGLQDAGWLLRWEWAQEYHNYNGAEDLLRWFEWTKSYPHYFSPEQIKPLAQLSEAKNREILRTIVGGENTPISILMSTTLLIICSRIVTRCRSGCG